MVLVVGQPAHVDSSPVNCQPHDRFTSTTLFGFREARLLVFCCRKVPRTGMWFVPAGAVGLVGHGLARDGKPARGRTSCQCGVVHSLTHPALLKNSMF